MDGSGMCASRFGFFFVLFLGGLISGKVDGQSTSCATSVKLHHGVPFVRVMVNGKGPFNFIVDTGTNRTVIVSPSLAKVLGLPIVGETSLLDLSGKVRERVNEVAVDTVSVGGREFHPGRALVHRNLATEGSYDGVLGFALFQNALLTLDYPQHCMTIAEGSLGDDGNALPLVLSRVGPMTALLVGNQAVMAVIDTGGGGLNLPESVARQVEFERSSEVMVREDTQVSTAYFRGGEIKGQLRLGAYVFKNPFVSIDGLIPFATIGSAPLQDFAVTFDQRHGLIRFEAKKNAHSVERNQLPSWESAGEAGNLTALELPAGGR